MRWRIWVDTGGTFTDGLAQAPDGSLRRTKILSSAALRGRVTRVIDGRRCLAETSWDASAGLVEGMRFRLLGDRSGETRVVGYDAAESILTLDAPLLTERCEGGSFELASDEEAPVLAARLLTRTPSGHPLPPSDLRLATTLGTNALLTRSGAPTVLFVTAGFGDLSRIGDQRRPDLFAVHPVKPEPLHAEVVEVRERLDAAGQVLVPLDLEDVVVAARACLDRGIRSAAIAFMHAYRNAAHETALARRLRDIGFEHVSCSADLAPRIKLLPRLETAVVDAYLGPPVQGYLDRVRAPAGDAMRLLAMTSAGGLIEASAYHAKDSLLSGPAGGVVGAVRAGRRHGCERLIGFDMGGTSTDVARFDGDFEYVYEHSVGAVHLAAPALAIESVAAGGGSVCWLDGERLRVGPASGGADPGPACYDAGGPLCVTDLNLLLGRLDAERFGIPVRPEAARAKLDELCAALHERTGERAEPGAVAEGLLAVADETMADAIRRISLRRGYDPANYTLVSFGGAGGQHAAAVATRLGISRVLVPHDAALLSAAGLGAAAVERFSERQILEPLDVAEPSLSRRFSELETRAREQLAAAGADPESIRVRRRILHLRWHGQEATIEIDWVADLDVTLAFESRYTELYGHRPERRSIELESIRVVAGTPATAPEPLVEPPDADPGNPVAVREARFAGRSLPTPVFERDALPPGATLDGPALIVEPHSTTVVPAGWHVKTTGEGLFMIAGPDAVQAGGDDGTEPEAVRLELFTQRFTSLVREMGERLERTAVSTNVKERLDFSCALLDPDGSLVVNAPHIPVHLGALGLCVRQLGETVDWQPGDAVLTNHPAYGGSHLPDITVVTPVFERNDGGALLGFVASRAHHAEIGGSRPGSMPPDATTLAEEGVVLPPVHVLRAGRPRWDRIRELLDGGPFPSRATEDNIADLRAAVAANHAGEVALRALCASYGAATVNDYMARLAGLTENVLRRALEAIPDGDYDALEKLDDGTPIAVRVSVHGDTATFDFSGSGSVHRGNLNATRAIVQSAVIYVLRLLLDRPLPLNEGLLGAVTLKIPQGLLNPHFEPDPARCPAVVGGNVETSQRVVDALLRALGLAACSQGTMNNLIFGNDRYGYYETIGGGAGAGPQGPGASCLHTHMTNTRITDPELLESRYPVRLECFARREGSGGEGRHRGGDGLIREITFLEPASLSLLTQHRVERPYGMDGGEPGQCGRQTVIRAGGAREELDGVDRAEMGAGDRLKLETPGGGGWGER